MLKYPVVALAPHKTEAVKRFHPWIFSGAIFKKDAAVTEGNMVEVQDTSGNFLALGYYSNGSIAVRILSFQPIESLENNFLTLSLIPFHHFLNRSCHFHEHRNHFSFQKLRSLPCHQQGESQGRNG